MTTTADAEVHMQERDFVMVERPFADEPTDQLHKLSCYVDNLSDEMKGISLDIHDHPELQYKEFLAHQILTNYLGAQPGWAVTASAYGISTAFVAVFDSKKPGPTVSLNAEYDKLAVYSPSKNRSTLISPQDALLGIGHACGHNLICVASLAAALASAHYIKCEDLSGKVSEDNGVQLGGPHTPDFEKAARTEEAHTLAMRVAKALAATAIDMLTRPELLAAAKAEFGQLGKQ